MPHSMTSVNHNNYNGGEKGVAMTTKQYKDYLWKKIVDEYYEEANYYLGVK